MNKRFIALTLLTSCLLCGCGNNSESSTTTTSIAPTSTPTTSSTSQSADPFEDIIEWKEGVTLQVPNGQIFLRKRKLTGGETYYMRRHSGSQGFTISVQYPDDSYVEGYDHKVISMTMVSSWSICIAKTSWVKFTIENKNTSSGQTSIYWYDY